MKTHPIILRRCALLALAAVTVLLVLSLSGCISTVTLTGRAYNLDTAEVLTVSYLYNGTGHGKITLITHDGERLEGEYSTLSGMSMSTGFGSASSPFGWAVAQGFSFNSPGTQYGSAVVAGYGLVIDAVYQVDMWSGHGWGVGKDNKGHKYRLQF